MTYQEQYQILRQPYIKVSQLQKILKISYSKTKKLWKQMESDLEKESGRKINSWGMGLPTQLVIPYLFLDLNDLEKKANEEKKDHVC